MASIINLRSCNRRFQGVATKYLDNYLYWFVWLEIDKHLSFEKQVEQMLVSACKKSNQTTVQKLRSAIVKSGEPHHK